MSEKDRKVLGTLEYMLNRNTYNKEQNEALMYCVELIKNNKECQTK